MNTKTIIDLPDGQVPLENGSLKPGQRQIPSDLLILSGHWQENIWFGKPKQKWEHLLLLFEHAFVSICDIWENT